MLLGRLGRALVGEKLMPLHAALMQPAKSGRQRDLFPFRLLEPGELLSLRPGLAADSCDAEAYVNGVILALNLLYGVTASCSAPCRRTLAQQRGLEVILAAAEAFAARLASVDAALSCVSGDQAWDAFEAGGSRPAATLDAMAVDVPEVAGSCDPLSVVSPEVASMLTADNIFPDHTPGLERFSGFFAGARQDYIMLCARQIQAGMLCLARSCRGGGTVFPVAKADGRQRVVWHGSRVSGAAAVPPPPRHLANPSVFAFLELDTARLLRVSKRDCKTWFDQLLLSTGLAPYMG